MPMLDAIFLGVIQGITEFLPISSSGHLVLFQHILDINQPGISLEIVLHLGTLAAVTLYFWPQIKAITKFQIQFLAIATFPALAVGLLISQFSDEIFSSLIVTAIGFFISGTLLTATKFLNPSSKTQKLNNQKSILIGLAQALAIMPGVSRSGTTVSTGLFLHLDKTTAFNFSFLLSIPAILAALAYQLISVKNLSSIFTPFNLIAMFTAFVVGLLALKLLQIIITRSKLHYFGIYCFCLGVITLILSQT